MFAILNFFNAKKTNTLRHKKDEQHTPFAMKNFAENYNCSSCAESNVASMGGCGGPVRRVWWSCEEGVVVL